MSIKLCILHGGTPSQLRTGADLNDDEQKIVYFGRRCQRGTFELGVLEFASVPALEVALSCIVEKAERNRRVAISESATSE